MPNININEMPFEIKELFVPSLDQVKNVLAASLTSNYREVSVSTVDCPNLTSAPYNLAAAGLGGSPFLIDIGGPSYLLPLADKTKIYDIKEIMNRLYQEKNVNTFVIGAGAGPHMLYNQNCEGIYNINIQSDGTITNKSYTARVIGPDENCILEKVPINEHKLALLANLYACEGKNCRVLRIHCKTRKGELNFITSIRLALQNFYKFQCVGLGGMFLLKNGSAFQHVMRPFSETAITSEEQLNDWLKFYEMPAVLNAVGTLITHENDLDLRLQHFHSFSNSHWGGHYHYDTTPETVEYEGYFNIAEKIIRIDMPKVSYNFGKD